MKKCIKIGIRNNLIYPAMLIISTLGRQIDSKIMTEAIGFKGDSLLLTQIMFLSEIIFGLILFKYNRKQMLKQKSDNIETKFKGIKLIQNKAEISFTDGTLKIYIFIFLVAYFDFIEFVLKTLYLPHLPVLKNSKLSKSLDIRLRGILVISSALLCYFLLKFPTYKHKKVSLLIIVICLILIIISEYFRELNHIKVLTYYLVLSFFDHFFNSFKDVIEKYLLEYNYLNPFQTLLIEGIFGFLMAFSYTFINERFVKEYNEINTLKNNEKGNIKVFSLIICFLFYFIFSGGKNIYRVLTNKIYSPTTKSLADSILDPFFIVFYYYFDRDFYNHKIHFIINIILSIIFVFCACVYNELFILFCFGLQHDTYREISTRSIKSESLSELADDYVYNNDED